MSRAKQPAGVKAMEQANAHLTSHDPAFSAIIIHAGPCPIGVSTDRNDPFASLVTSVVSQQLSTTAASTISARLITHAGGELRPDVLLNSYPEQLRAVGLSGAKVRTIQGLADAIEQGNLDLDGLAERGDDEELMAALTSLWGIGTWTVHMFMIFTLGRRDVWPAGDLGVRKGWNLLHGEQGDPGMAGFDVVADALSPYRSVAAWYCWRELERR